MLSKAAQAISLIALIAVTILYASAGQAAAPWEPLKTNDCSNETSAPYTGTAMTVNPCQGKGNSLVVALNKNALFLCKEGKPQKSFKVALGLGGIGKKLDGDNKTPVGSYGLGAPRISGQGFGVFIPVGYPTPEQAKQGYTGNSVGVHGPPRANKCDGASNVSINWTWGCIAVSDDESIAEVADFVKNTGVQQIHLLNIQTQAAVEK